MYPNTSGCLSMRIPKIRQFNLCKKLSSCDFWAFEFCTLIDRVKSNSRICGKQVETSLVLDGFIKYFPNKCKAVLHSSLLSS